MKSFRILMMAVGSLLGLYAHGQGTFLYDQQSSTDEGGPGFGWGQVMQNIPSPWGQSFTPALDAISFIRLKFDDANTSDGLGVTIHLNLHSGSISGPIIGTSASVTLPNGSEGPANFFFSHNIPVTPEAMYYFEPIVESGGTWNIDAFSYNYPRGYAIYGGSPLTGTDLWFREGLYIIPEPSPIPLLIVGFGAYATIGRRRHSGGLRARAQTGA